MKKKILLSIMATTSLAFGAAEDQDQNYSPIASSNSKYQIEIQEDSSLCNGLPNLQSFSSAQYSKNGNDYWVIIGGITGGKHIFDSNKNVYVCDLKENKVYQKEISKDSTNLNQDQIDAITSSNTESYNDDGQLYIVGGYGQASDGNYKTYDALTRVNLDNLITWVTDGNETSKTENTFSQIKSKDNESISVEYLAGDKKGTTEDLELPFFEVSGGSLQKLDDNSFALVFGQVYNGKYKGEKDGDYQGYTKNVRVFNIKSPNESLDYDKVTTSTDPLNEDHLRRRDLNVVQSATCSDESCNQLQYYSTALAGVFTPEGGVWTRPVFVSADGQTNESLSTNYNQGVNQYESATLSLFSKEDKAYTALLFGGITRQAYDGNEFVEDADMPNTNQVIAYTKSGFGDPKLGNNIVQTHVGDFPGNIKYEDENYTEGKEASLFGSNAEFFVSSNLKKYDHEIVDQDQLKDGQTLGYIYGGIETTKYGKVDNLTTRKASNRVFKVTYNKV